MKRVLMISHAYPPMGAPGALRVGKFARYLPEFGWEPVVLTPRGAYSRGGTTAVPMPGVRVVTTPHAGGLEKAAAGALKGSPGPMAIVVRAVKGLLYPDRVAPWLPFALAAGIRLARRERFDAVYSSSPSIVNHMVALRLSRAYRIPWVIDFRDLWTQGPLYGSTGARARLDRRLERAFMGQAGRVLTVSEHNARELSAAYPEFAGKVRVVRNGFDPADLPPPSAAREPFVLSYAGGFYGGLRDPRGLFAALAMLRDAGEISAATFRMELIGDREPAVLAMVDDAGVGDLVHHVGRLPYSETLARLATSRALCVITFTAAEAQGEMTTKLFEYLGVGRPILALTIAGSELGALVESTGVGAALHPQDREGIAAWLRARIAEAPARAGLPEEVLAPFSRRTLTGALARCLEDAVRAG